MSLPYTYTPDVPQGSQQINQTQAPINYNFQDIYDIMAVNHIGFNVADTFGTHNFINFVTQSTDPSTASAEMAFYTKAVDDENGVEIFYRYPSDGSVLQLTGTGASTGTTSSSNTAGTGGGYFYFNSEYATLGTPEGGYCQYLSNGILMMTWQVVNGQYSYTSPITLQFPSPYYNYMQSGNLMTVPTFTQSVFNLQISSTNPQGSSNIGVNYSVTIVDTTSALLYLNNISSSSGLQGSITCTAIGI